MKDIREVWRQYGGEYVGDWFGGALQNDLGDYIRQEVFDREWVLLAFALPNYFGGPTRTNAVTGAVVVDTKTHDAIAWAEDRDPMEAVARAVLRAEVVDVKLREARGELNVQ